MKPSEVRALADTAVDAMKKDLGFIYGDTGKPVTDREPHPREEAQLAMLQLFTGLCENIATLANKR